MIDSSSTQQELSEAALKRLHPSLTNPNYLVLRARRLIFEKWMHKLGNNLDVLDVGGRYQPYRPLLGEKIRRYLAIDLIQTDLVDVVCSGEAMPFAKNSFDVIIATQVFEFFAEPLGAANQIHNMLKPGGILLMSVASLAPRFANKECWRFTPAGIRATLRAFSRVEIVAETSNIGGLLRMANLGLRALLRYGVLQKTFDVSVCPCLNLCGLLAERLGNSNQDQFVANYSVLAVKE